jgi:hypothetical protein
MGRCNHCKKWIIGGIRENSLRYCSPKCHEDGFLCKLVEGVDDKQLTRILHIVHQQQCSTCNNSGPVDLYTKHTATSFVIFSSWKDTQKLCCRSCGSRHVIRGILWTLTFGWWSFTGIFIALWQLIKSFKQLRSLPNTNHPSPALTKMVKLDLANLLTAAST